MFTIHISTPVPNLKDLRGSLANQLESIKNESLNFQEFIDNISIDTFPNILGLPSPIFPDYSNATQELLEVVDAIKYQADTFTMMNIFKPLIAVVGGSLEDLIPKIPVLDVSIIDILDGGTQAIYDSIVKAIKSGVKLPYLPLDMFSGFSNFSKEALLSLKMILVGYKELLIDTMQSLIKQVMSILDISGLIPVIPTIPTFEQLKSTALDYFDDCKSWEELMSEVSPDAILDVFGLGGFLIPESLFIPNFSNFEQYIMESLNQIKDSLLTLGLGMLVDFIENNLGFLGFSFPSFTVTIGF